MGRMSQAYSLEELEKVLRVLGEDPKWKKLPNSQHQHKSVKFKAVVNIWTSKGTVLVQGGGAASFEKALKEALGEVPAEQGATGEALPVSISREGCNGTAHALFETPAVEAVWNLFVDGSCPRNRNVREKAAAAGWGVAVGRTAEGASSGLQWTAELYGPVVIDRDSPLSLGAEVGSNNTGELSALGEAMLWLRDEAPGSKTLPAAVHYDSQYAANIATGRNRAHKNLELASTVQQLYAEVKQQRPLNLVYVKGHSGVSGNELADRLAAMGAEGRYATSSKRWSQFSEAAKQAATALRNITVATPEKLAGVVTASPHGSQKRVYTPAAAPAELLILSPDGSRKRLPTPATSLVETPTKRLRQTTLPFRAILREDPSSVRVDG